MKVGRRDRSSYKEVVMILTIRREREKWDRTHITLEIINASKAEKERE